MAAAALILATFALALVTVSCGGNERSQAQLVSEGRDLFQTTCAACHGPDLKGTTSGPSFLSDIYAPDHHPDASFSTAVKNGVQQHHWNFGAMPPQQGIDDADIEAIIAYVRSEQQKSGPTTSRE